jgi:NAD(P)-binding Rossmann-like domain/Flavin containing amine oxidoreductase/Acetoacetate decarboxylase (ADC)
MADQQTVRVAILGGGMAGVAAAWELVTNAPCNVTYDVTVYDATWRLGGKCASGRDVALGSRIEEHGIHVLMGFYSQVFRILRDGYATLPPALGFPPFDEALVPSDLLQLPDFVNGAWTFWPLTFPTNDRVPGAADPNTRDLAGAILKATHLVAQWRLQYEAAVVGGLRCGAVLHDLLGALDTCVEAVENLAAAAPHIEQSLASFLEDPPPSADVSLELRHLWMAIYFGATNLLGIVRDRLFTPADFQADAINALDYKAWLKGVGGEFPSPELTWDSPIVNAVYDLVFSRATGFAAGVALYDVLLMLLDYAGHVFYRMAGTGDVIFGPLYFALKQKNVSFRFEHTVTDVRMGVGPGGQPEVDTIVVVGDGTERTVAELFIDIDGQPCWPSASLVNRPTKQITLTRADFDYVISAIPIGALIESAPAIAALPPVANAIEKITTIPTQSIQLWFDQTMDDMGWKKGQIMLGSFARPFNSCADMAQVLAQEQWGAEKGVLYFSDVFDGNATDPVAATALVRTRAISWIEQNLPTLLPTFTWDRLIDPAGSLGSDRFQSQYWRANVTGTELYVASSPGSVSARLPADGSGVANLLLASDWVQTEENAGCVEGAARSGANAAVKLGAWVAGLTAAITPKGGTTTSLPTYVQRDDDWVFPHPVLLSGTKVKAFPLLADLAQLTALCAQNSIGGVTIRPWLSIAPLVLVFAGGCDAISSTDPNYATWGRLAEREVGVFVPVVVEQGGASFVALLCPYLFVDNGATLIAGRETFGLPKELATFSTWDLASAPPIPLQVIGLTLPNRGDLAVEEPVLTLTSGLLAASATASAEQALVKSQLEQLWKALTAGTISVPLVALKQFHAIENGTSACYQQIVRCSIQPSNMQVKVGLTATTITLPEYFFPKIAANLGLAEASLSLVSVDATLDLRLTVGEVVGG